MAIQTIAQVNRRIREVRAELRALKQVVDAANPDNWNRLANLGGELAGLLGLRANLGGSEPARAASTRKVRAASKKSGTALRKSMACVGNHGLKWAM